MVPLVVKNVAEAVFNVVWPVTVRVAMVVVARVEVPVTTEEPVVVLFAIFALVITALVVVELPTMRSVMLARADRREEKNPVVEVMAVADALLKFACPVTVVEENVGVSVRV